LRPGTSSSSGSSATTPLGAGLSYTHRKEYAQWVGGGEREQTRLSRAARSVSMLVDRIRTPG